MAFAMAWRAAAHRRAGRLVDAEADVRQTLEAFRSAGHLPMAPALLGTLAEILFERGEPEAAVEAFAAAEVPDSPPETIPGTRLLHSRAQLRIANGEVRGGVEDLLEVGRRLQAWGFSGPAWLAWRSSAGIALVALGETERGEALIDEEVRGARSFGAPRPLGMALRAAGLCQDEDRAIDLLNDAVAVLVDSADRLEHARALVDLGAALRRSRQRGAAISRLREGLDLASRCSARALAERARSELRVAGAKPRRDALRGSDALTASELRVARMAAAGMANKRIAQDLFVSLRTVETHLTHVYRKLGIASRAELPPALAAAGNAAGSSAAEVR